MTCVNRSLLRGSLFIENMFFFVGLDTPVLRFFRQTILSSL